MSWNTNIPRIQFQLLQAHDAVLISQIARWYEAEWNIPAEKTIEKLALVSTDPSQLQLIMTLDQQAIGTAGIYHHIGLLDKEPRFSIYPHWLALVYTTPEHRRKGYGALICQAIEEHAAARGIKEMLLFTDTAESLYKRLNWLELERLSLGNRNIVVMKKNLIP